MATLMPVFDDPDPELREMALAMQADNRALMNEVVASCLRVDAALRERFGLDPTKKKRVKSELVPPPPNTDWSVQQIAQRWGKSDDYVRRHFKKMSGILVDDKSARSGKHRHRSFTVPTAVLLRDEAQRTLK
jgi:hypothetical protein